MTSIASATSSVGAGVSQGRFQSLNQATRLTDQTRVSEDVRSAALKLLRAVLSDSGATGHDLDVLA